MRYETSRTTTAEPSRLWAVVSDVERWPEWIEVYEEVRRAEPGPRPLKLGDSAHVKQRGLAAGDWTVTELDDGIQLEMTGPLSGAVTMLLGTRTRSYVDLECARLTAVAAEQHAA
jgi:hypothetical protein